MYILKAKSNTVLGFKLRITETEYLDLSFEDKQYYELESQMEIDYPKHNPVTDDYFSFPPDDTPSHNTHHDNPTDNSVEFGGGSFGGGGSSSSYDSDSSSSDSGGGDSGGGGGD